MMSKIIRIPDVSHVNDSFAPPFSYLSLIIGLTLGLFTIRLTPRLLRVKE